jgi:hypothetical protein
MSHIIGKKLERDESAKPRILGLMHHAHTPTTKLFHDAVVETVVPIMMLVMVGGYPRQVKAEARPGNEIYPEFLQVAFTPSVSSGLSVIRQKFDFRAQRFMNVIWPYKGHIGQVHDRSDHGGR